MLIVTELMHLFKDVVVYFMRNILNLVGYSVMLKVDVYEIKLWVLEKYDS